MPTLLGEIKRDFEEKNKNKIVLIGSDDQFYNKKAIEEYTYDMNPDGTYPSEALIKALELSGGNISRAAKVVGCTRNVYYNRMKDSELFKLKVDEIRETKIDYAEDKLQALIEIGNPQAVTFYLSTIGKKRGYTKTTEVVGGDVPVQININLGEDNSEEDYG